MVPVTVFPLVESAPALPGGLAGLAEPFREEEIGFEVAGRVEFVYDVGEEVKGARLGPQRELLERGESLGPVASVASFFLSRIDVMVDQRLDAMDVPEARELRGRRLCQWRPAGVGSEESWRR